MGRTARLLDRRDRAAERPDGSVTLLERPEAEPISPASLWRPSLVASIPPHFSAAVAAEVIPRLRLAHAAPAMDLPAELLPDAADVEALSMLLVRHDVAGAEAYVEALSQAGTAMERLFLDLLAPSARLLGDWWASDRCDFATVTLGTMHLRRMQRDLAPRLIAGGEARLRSEAHKVLLVPLPGEQHVFGLDMVASFFRRAGWQARVAPLRAVEELTSRNTWPWWGPMPPRRMRGRRRSRPSGCCACWPSVTEAVSGLKKGGIWPSSMKEYATRAGVQSPEDIAGQSGCGSRSDPDIRRGGYRTHHR